MDIKKGLRVALAPDRGTRYFFEIETWVDEENPTIPTDFRVGLEKKFGPESNITVIRANREDLEMMKGAIEKALYDL